MNRLRRISISSPNESAQNLQFAHAFSPLGKIVAQVASKGGKQNITSYRHAWHAHGGAGPEKRSGYAIYLVPVGTKDYISPY